MPSMVDPLGVPLPTVKRLPLYLRVLRECEDRGEAWVSSDALGKRLRLGAIQVRKDISAVGGLGRAKYGFPVSETAHIISEFLGSDDYADVFLIGAGAQGAAVLADENVQRHGFKVVAVFDTREDRVGSTIFGHRVRSLSEFVDLSTRMGVLVTILAVEPSEVRQAVQAIARSSVEGVFDVTGFSVPLPDRIVAVRADFGSALSSLAGTLGERRRASLS